METKEKLYFSLNSCGNTFKDVMSYQCDRKFLNCPVHSTDDTTYIITGDCSQDDRLNHLELSPFLDTIYELVPAPDELVWTYKKTVDVPEGSDIDKKLYVLKRASIDELYDEGERKHLFPESVLNIPSIFLSEERKSRDANGDSLFYFTEQNENAAEDPEYVPEPKITHYLSLDGFVTDINKAALVVVVDLPEEPIKKEKKTEDSRYKKMFDSIMSSPLGIDETSEEKKQKKEEARKKNMLPFILPKEIPIEKIDLNTSLLNQTTFVVDKEEEDGNASETRTGNAAVDDTEIFGFAAPPKLPGETQKSPEGKEKRLTQAQIRRKQKQEALKKEASKAQWFVQIISFGGTGVVDSASEDNGFYSSSKIKGASPTKEAGMPKQRDKVESDDDYYYDENESFNSNDSKPKINASELRYLATQITVSLDPDGKPTDLFDDTVQLLSLTQKQKDIAQHIEKIIDRKMRKVSAAVKEMKASGKVNAELMSQLAKVQPKTVTSTKWQLMPLMSLQYYDKAESSSIGIEVDPDVTFNNAEKEYMMECGYPFFSHIMSDSFCNPCSSLTNSVDADPDVVG